MTSALRTARILVLFSCVIVTGPTIAGPIRDNSFLLEEAYNQEAGVIQHIATYTRDRSAGGWTSTFTQEWPVRDETHQVSFTLPFEGSEDGVPDTSGVGDLLLNYRFQALGGPAGKPALAPRISLLLPSGDETEGRGAGGPGLQVNVPFSVEFSRRFVAHTNVGSTVIPSGKSATGDDQRMTAFLAGQGLIWLASDNLNFMVEALWSRETGEQHTLLVSPGIRGAINFDSGLQIVPGLAFPMSVGGDDEQKERSVLLYLSFEHPLPGHDS